MQIIRFKMKYVIILLLFVNIMFGYNDIEIKGIKEAYVDGEYIKFTIINNTNEIIYFDDFNLFCKDYKIDSVNWLPIIKSKYKGQILNLKIKKNSSLSYTIDFPIKYFVSDSIKHQTRKLELYFGFKGKKNQTRIYYYSVKKR